MLKASVEKQFFKPTVLCSGVKNHIKIKQVTLIISGACILENRHVYEKLYKTGNALNEHGQ
jgi:predicted Rossmann-fold nucleotide-binding protein